MIALLICKWNQTLTKIREFTSPTSLPIAAMMRWLVLYAECDGIDQKCCFPAQEWAAVCGNKMSFTAIGFVSHKGVSKTGKERGETKVMNSDICCVCNGLRIRFLFSKG